MLFPCLRLALELESLLQAHKLRLEIFLVPGETALVGALWLASQQGLLDREAADNGLYLVLIGLPDPAQYLGLVRLDVVLGDRLVDEDARGEEASSLDGLEFYVLLDVVGLRRPPQQMVRRGNPPRLVALRPAALSCLRLGPGACVQARLGGSTCLQIVGNLAHLGPRLLPPPWCSRGGSSSGECTRV